MNLTIALDARTIYAARRRGTGKNLLDAYRAMARLRPRWRFLMYHRARDTDDPFAGFENVFARRIEMPGDRWDLWGNLRLPLAAGQDGADLLHCPASRCCRLGGLPVVTTIHDVVPLKLPDLTVDQQAERFRRQVERCLLKSRRIIAVSESTRRDLISDFDADPLRIDVIAWAADSACDAVGDEAELARVRSRYKIEGRYMLAFSGRSYRKNAEGMVRGYAALPESLSRAVQFVLIGVEPAGQRERLARLVQDQGLADRCLVFGFAPEKDVAPLLSGADLLAFCSLYEGFGLPILDAFRCGTAVLTAERSSMPEVAGAAAVYCDPSDPQSIAAGMNRMLSDDRLRAQLARSGLQRLQLFTWERTASQMCGVFQECIVPAAHGGVSLERT